MLSDELIKDCIYTCSQLHWLNNEKRVWPATHQLWAALDLPASRKGEALRYLARFHWLRRVVPDLKASTHEYGWMFDHLTANNRVQPAVPLRRLWRHIEKQQRQLICLDTGLRKPLTDMFTVL